MTPLQFPGTGTAQDEPQFFILYQPVDFVQKDRELLYFVDDDGVTLGAAVNSRSETFLADKVRLEQKPLKFRGEQEIKAHGLREKYAKKRAFPCLTGPPEETSFLRAQL